MNSNDATHQINDQIEIAQLLVNWGTWRDSGEFEKLRSCYTADARMVTSWYDGPAESFVDLVAQVQPKQPTDHGAMHLIGGTTSRVNGERAIAETRISILMRGLLNDRLVDVTTHGRFIDFLRKVDGQWRIQSREPIYDKDTLQPVEPGVVLELDEAKLAGQPVGFRHMAYVQAARGMNIITTIPAPNSEEARQLYRRADAWLDASHAAA